MSIHGVLGETTSYPKTYQPETLYAIPRTMGRANIAWSEDKLAIGVDWWQAFEVSWLNTQGVSQVAIARFSIPASSPNIVESKSLKLYLNSLNFTEFASWQMVKETIAKDLSDCVGAKVDVDLFALTQQQDSFLIQTLQGECIDSALDNSEQKLSLLDHPDASLLKDSSLLKDKGDNPSKLESNAQHYQLYSNLLRSNCPVTNQPDWGAVAIEMTTKIRVNKANLLKYILSFRQHNGFHEQCVEQIFADCSAYFEPSSLMVRAWYTRRGGIDISPCRVSHPNLLPKPSRLIRQ